MPFAWGSSANDCVSFAAAAAGAQTGVDHLVGLEWEDEAGAYRALDVEGGLEAAMSKRLRAIAPAMAQRGDVAGVMSGNELGLMIVEGETLVGPGPRGLRRRRRAEMVCAWSAA